MEWTVVGVLVVLVGLIISVLTPAIKLNTSVTKLSTLVDQLSSQLKAMESSNKEAHQRLWSELDGHKQRLSEHETRITVLENRETRT